jgi:hypothetical protein
MSFYGTNFVKRQMLSKSVGDYGFGGTNTRPELTPADPIQGHLFAAQIQGGGEVYLGPYDFQIQSKAISEKDAETSNYWYIPPSVTLIGVPNKTKIYKTTYYQEGVGNAVVNKKSLGPVVSLGGKASIVNCMVSLDMWTEYEKLGVAHGSGARSSLYFMTDGGSGTKLFAYGLGDVVVGWENSCIIYLPQGLARRRVEGCTIGDSALTVGGSEAEKMSMIGIYNEASGSEVQQNIITNNFFMNSCESHFTAGVYVDTGVSGTAIVGNVARPYFTAGADACDTFVSFEDAAHLSYNVVSGNVPSNAASSTSFGLRT